MTVRTATRAMTLADAFGDARASSIARDAALVVGGAALTGLAAQVSFTAPGASVPYTTPTWHKASCSTRSTIELTSRSSREAETGRPRTRKLHSSSRTVWRIP